MMSDSQGQRHAEDRHKRLVAALSTLYWDKYVNNAWFKTSVDQLALFLEVLVDGLALRAEQEDETFRERLAAMERGLS